MNSFYEYFAAQQKMAAYRQAKRMQRGVKLGYNQYVGAISYEVTKFSSNPINIGLNDFSIEFYGNSYGSATLLDPFLYNASNIESYTKGYIAAYNVTLGNNGVYWVVFEKPASGELTDDSLIPRYKDETSEGKFLMTITRQGKTVKVYINGELKDTKEQSAVKDLGDLQLAIANSSDVGFVRVWNYALSADDVTALYNDGDPMGYVVPRAKRTSLLAEYLPQNLLYGRDDKTIATSWLDSAKQLPLSDEYMEPLFQSIGGYDMAANGAPEILYNE